MVLDLNFCELVHKSQLLPLSSDNQKHMKSLLINHRKIFLVSRPASFEIMITPKDRRMIRHNVKYILIEQSIILPCNSVTPRAQNGGLWGVASFLAKFIGLTMS